ncbi:MAG: SDR family oxidoreductase [Polyangiaceae bacterium]|jgi:NAD(P)-dependent dehydrogenase (short-subunit alcohol dehydrogenase family)|nr:SDR family oxidoreductase [Polyangiaceae bacterium]
MSKTIFITGSSTGLGRATAHLFASRGWKVIATMRKPAGDELGQTAGITLLPLDVTEPAQIDAAVRRALELGPVDVVFNNAGYGLAGPFEGTSDEQIVAELNTNLLGVLRTTRAFLPSFRERRAGVFIATTSIGGLATFPFNSVYHATKWGLEGWSESLAFELQEFGIQVKTVAPGGIKTDFAGRSLVLAKHPAYEATMGRVLAAFMDPARAANASSAESIAEVVWEAATDGKDQVTYVAGEDAKGLYAQRLAVGVETFRKTIGKAFLGG